MSLANLNPFIRYARSHQRFFLSKQFLINYDCRLFYIQSGEGYLQTPYHKYPFSTNTAIYIPPRTQYRFRFHESKKPWSVMIFNFDLVDSFSHISDALGSAECQIYDPSLSPNYPIEEEFSNIIIEELPNMFSALQNCTQHFLSKTPYYREFGSATLKTCLLQLLYARFDSGLLHIIKQIQEYIHAQYHKSDLTNEQIAINFGYHPSYLSQLFKEQTGETLYQYLLSHRIRIAKNYLITTDLDIKTISWKCGFNSCAHFIKQFHQLTGTTPGKFRKENSQYLL